ncbi:hypothetical protein Tco_1022061, partial [Tanacetum coccineum]
VVPNPVLPVSDWRPWPYVLVHSPIRDPTPEPVSPPTPPAQTFIFEEPLVFGPEPRPAGYFRLNPEVDVGLELWRDVNMLCQSLHPDDVEDFWCTQDKWIVSSWKLYPKSSVHVLDLTNGKTVYMFVDKVYPIRATLLERMLRHRLTVPPSYCRDVFVAGHVIQTVQDGLRLAYECIASAPM